MAMYEKIRVFDWEKAAKIILERKAEKAVAGIDTDWLGTRDAIYKDGKPVENRDSGAYLQSHWGFPTLSVNGDMIQCYREVKVESDELFDWWPDRALEVLNQGGDEDA